MNRDSAPSFNDDDILAAWRGGMDTVDLAKKFWRTEAEMYSRLHRILERQRDWNIEFRVTLEEVVR